jgi:branched-chain amino acid transport system substrate-binding protein
VIGLSLVAVLAFAAVACGDDETASDDDATTDASDGGGSDATLSTAELLGEPNPASGEPVKVGLIGTGADCATCSAGGALEQPAAEATVEWANEYLGGVGGHPIELVVCDNELDPSKSIDCANEMITEGVAAVVLGADSTVTGWEVLHEAGIPVISQSTTQTAMVEDPDSTFVLQDSTALTVEFPIGAAVEAGADKVSIMVIDTPAATDIYTDENLAKFEDAGLEVEVIPIPFGTPDMTPQAQQIVQDNPDGLVNIVGHDAFCIPAIQGLQAAGFTGSIGTISFCTTDAMREAIPSDVVDGMLLAADAALADPSNESTQQYNAVMDEFATSDIPGDASSANAIFSAFGALAIATAGLEGEVTPESVIEAMRAMENQLLPGSGGRQFRCNGQAAEASPAACSASGLSATLNEDGLPESYTVFNDEPIPD